ncbi:MAG: hypothetical protein SO533_00995 [Eubacteriales bacterium]|nr:hypothetical protein [Eubacteriales bacterium]
MVWYLYLSESPRSHLLTAAHVTFIATESCSCVMSLAVRNACNLSLEALKDKRFDFVRNEEAFQKIIADLKEYAE